MMTHHTNSAPTSRLCSSVLTRIETEGIEPRSRWYFLVYNALMWGIWALTIFLGAVAVAVTIYALVRSPYALYEATHESFFTFLVEIVPYVWLVSFIVLSGMAYLQFRCTRRGYRYPLWQVLGSSLAFSLVGGVALQVAGFGTTLDTELNRYVPFYRSLEAKELALWQRPDDGRLVGAVPPASAGGIVSEPEGGELAMVAFQDVGGVDWNLLLAELEPEDRRTLLSGERVRVLGLALEAAPGGLLAASSSLPSFYACGVFPWMFSSATTLRDLEAQREAFVRRMHSYLGDPAGALERGLGVSGIEVGRTEQDKSAAGRCANLTAVRRMEMMQR